MVFGYARVSTSDQNLSLQLDALTKAGCDQVFQEKMSGRYRDRPELDRLLSMLRRGDKVVVWKLDRLGRSVRNLVELADRFQQEGVDLVVLADSIDTSTAPGRFFFNVMAAFAQLEREVNSERTKAGLESARKQGRVGGRPAGLSPQAQRKADAANTLRQQGKSADEIASTLNLSRATVYRYLQ